MKDRLKKLRKILGLTQAQFGEKIGLKPTAIGMYESGDRNITEQTIKLVCKEFSVNENWLRDGDGSMFISCEQDILIKVAEIMKNQDMKTKQKLINFCVNLSDDELIVLTKFAQTLLDDKKE